MGTPSHALLLKRLLNRVSYVLPGGYTVRPWVHRLRGVTIGERVWISQLVYIDEIHPEAVTIGDRSTIGLRTSILAHFYWGPRKPDGAQPVTVGADVFIGPHCVLLPGVSVGAGAVVVAGTVVSRSVPAGALWGTGDAGVLGTATVPLTRDHAYSEFVLGLRSSRGKQERHGDLPVTPG